MTTVVIVDAYAPTRRLAPAFRSAGCDVVRVLSTPEPPLVYRAAFDESAFAATVRHDGDLGATLDAVAAHRPVAVVAAGESGVEMADLLSSSLGLPSNGTTLSAARRDKHTQISAVRAAGLRVPSSVLVESAEQLDAWHRARGARVVVKPVRSAAGDGVSFCDTPQESVAAYHRLLGAENIFSARNDAVVAQEYLIGGEYVVNTVSSEGRHHVTDLWKYDKISANGVPDLTTGVRLLPRHGEVQEAICGYAGQVLDALGIAYGAAHLELKLTPGGPCLVEVGARLAGLDMPHLAAQCLGEAQVEWLVDAYVRPDRFADRWKDDYVIGRHARIALPVSTMDGVLRAYPMIGVVEALESLHELRRLVGPGDRLRRTVDDMTWPLLIQLVHPVEEIAERDYGTIRHLDGPAFYEVAS